MYNFATEAFSISICRGGVLRAGRWCPFGKKQVCGGLCSI